MSEPVAPAVHRQLAAPALAFVAISLAAFLPLSFSKHAESIAPFWPANAMAVVILLRAPRTSGLRWDLKLAIMLALLAGNVAAGNSVLLSAGFTLANGVEIGATVWLLRGGVPLRRLGQSASSDLKFVAIIVAGLAGPGIGAIAGALALSDALGRPFWQFWIDWFLPSALSTSIIVPLGLLLRLPNFAERGLRAALTDCLLCIGLPIGAALIALHNPSKPLLFIITPVVIVAAVRLRALGVAVAIFSIIYTATPIVSGSGGVIALATYASPHDRLLIMQLFLLVQTVIGLILAHVLDRHDNLIEALKAERDRSVEDGKQRLRLLMGVSHEIRTPLNVIVGMSEILSRRGSVTAEDRELLETVFGASKQLQMLAVDLLESARFAQGSLRLSPECVLAEPIVRDAVEEAKHNAQVRGDVQINIPAATSVWADPVRFQQIVQNLVSNALKNGADFGPVSVSVYCDRQGAHVEVRDCGPGFAAGASQTVFEPFSKQSPRMSGRRGAGVGLSLVKQLAEAHGGRVGLSSASHVETCVWVMLPLQGSQGALDAAQPKKHDVRNLDPEAVFGPM